MNDEQMQSALDEWFEDTDPQPPNARPTATRVMAQVPQTRQRGRWLPFRLFRPKAQTQTATDTTDYQPSPIPATNGHAPTVTGRTQSMFSPAKAITAGALVFALGGVLLITQPFDQQGGGVPGAATDEAATVVAFDPEAFQFSEGVAVDEDGNVYASLSPLGQLVRVAPGADLAETVGSVEGIGEGDQGLLGLAVGPDGAVYAALHSQNPDANGVWRFDPATGAAERVAGTEVISFPNDPSFGDDGTMYVTSTVAGTVWRVPEGGSAEPWIGDPLLAGTGEAGFGIPFGANGIEVVGDTAYVGVSETAQVVAIPINDDGTAGTPTTFVQHDSLIDGVAVDAAGNVYTTHPFANEVRRVNADGDIEVVATVDDGLDGPTSVAIGPGAEGETAYIASFTGALLGGEVAAGPSIVSVPTGGE